MTRDLGMRWIGGLVANECRRAIDALADDRR